MSQLNHYPDDVSWLMGKIALGILSYFQIGYFQLLKYSDAFGVHALTLAPCQALTDYVAIVRLSYSATVYLHSIHGTFIRPPG
ncbi:hypothetical protein Tco_0610789 [Tanacetum coccineum]